MYDGSKSAEICSMRKKGDRGPKLLTKPRKAVAQQKQSSEIDFHANSQECLKTFGRTYRYIYRSYRYTCLYIYTYSYKQRYMQLGFYRDTCKKTEFSNNYCHVPQKTQEARTSNTITSTGSQRRRQVASAKYEPKQL